MDAEGFRAEEGGAVFFMLGFQFEAAGFGVEGGFVVGEASISRRQAAQTPPSTGIDHHSPEGQAQTGRSVVVGGGGDGARIATDVTQALRRSAQISGCEGDGDGQQPRRDGGPDVPAGRRPRVPGPGEIVRGGSDGHGHLQEQGEGGMGPELEAHRR